MTRRTIGFPITLALSIFLAPLVAASLPRNVVRIGFLSPFSPVNCDIDVLRHALRQLNWVEGQNLTFEARWADGEYAKLPPLAAELVQRTPDVLRLHGNAAAWAAKQVTTTIDLLHCPMDVFYRGMLLSFGRLMGFEMGRQTKGGVTHAR